MNEYLLQKASDQLLAEDKGQTHREKLRQGPNQRASTNRNPYQTHSGRDS